MICSTKGEGGRSRGGSFPFLITALSASHALFRWTTGRSGCPTGDKPTVPMGADYNRARRDERN
jgi:hypothetical protein